jgi:hypothetical protein
MSTRPRRALVAPVALTLLLGTGLAACSEDTEQQAEDALESAKEDIENAANDTAARAQAEAFRGALLVADLEDDADRRSVDALQEAGDDLPHGTVEGIVDGDGDGLDDDGLVQVESDDQAACVRISADGDVSVTDEPCNEPA